MKNLTKMKRDDAIAVLHPHIQQYYGIEDGVDAVDNVMMSEEDEAVMMDGMEDAVEGIGLRMGDGDNCLHI